MNLRMLRTLLLLALASPLLLQAHDPSKHKGQGTRGEVVSVAGDRLELKTAAGVKTVILSDKTKLERGDQAARASDLKKGDPVLVFGTTLATGELVAREILIRPGGREAHKK